MAYLRWLIAVVVVATAHLLTPARAAIVNTYEFDFLGGWKASNGNPLDGYDLKGTFTGTLEADGTIGLQDLSSFEVILSGGSFGKLPNLELFSYNTHGGVSSLTFVAGVRGDPGTFCAGGAVNVVPVCNPDQTNPPAATASSTFFLSYTTVTPTIRLESSVVTGVPEVSTWFMMVIGFAAVGLLWRQRNAGRAFMPVAREVTAS